MQKNQMEFCILVNVRGKLDACSSLHHRLNYPATAPPVKDPQVGSTIIRVLTVFGYCGTRSSM